MKSLEAFLDRIVELYIAARSSADNFVHPNIKRGRISSIAGLAEDAFAELLIEQEALANFQIWVDTPFFFPVDYKKTSKAFYPDMAIIELNASCKKIKSIVDLKLDMGHLRNIKKYGERARWHLEQLKKKGKVKRKGEELVINVNLRWHVVVVSNANMSRDNQMEIIKTLKEFSDDISIHFLSNGKHPNYKQRELVIADNIEWNNFLEMIESDLKN